MGTYTFWNLFKSKKKIRFEKTKELMNYAQEKGAFATGLSKKDMKDFIDKLIVITNEYGYGVNGEGEIITSLPKFIERRISNTSSRVQYFWMDVLDYYEIYYNKNKNQKS